VHERKVGEIEEVLYYPLGLRRHAYAPAVDKAARLSVVELGNGQDVSRRPPQ